MSNYYLPDVGLSIPVHLLSHLIFIKPHEVDTPDTPSLELRGLKGSEAKEHG